MSPFQVRLADYCAPPTSPTADGASAAGKVTDLHSITERILSMSKLGVIGAVVPLVSRDISLQSVEEEACKDGSSRQQVREKLSDNGMEWQVAELVEEDIGAAKQFLGSKTLWATPMSVTAVIYSHHRPEYFSIEPEPDGPF